MAFLSCEPSKVNLQQLNVSKYEYPICRKVDIKYINVFKTNFITTSVNARSSMIAFNLHYRDRQRA